MRANSIPSMHDRLVRETEQSRRGFLAIPIIQRALRGDVTLAEYLAFLNQAYHHVRQTVPLMMGMGYHLAHRLDWMQKVVAEYVSEEIGHEQWILEDIAASGGDAEAARNAPPLAATEMMIAYAHDTIQRGNPLGFLGMVFVLEGTSAALATLAADAIRGALNLPAHGAALPDLPRCPGPGASGLLRGRGQSTRKRVGPACGDPRRQSLLRALRSDFPGHRCRFGTPGENPMKIAFPCLAVIGALLLAVTSASASTASMDAALLDLEHGWAHVTYALPAAQQDDAYTALESRASTLMMQYPQRAEPKVWQAIILSSHAGEHGGLGALSMVRKARDLLLQAEKINPDVMHGSIYTTLGSLYYQVPGWPLGFGNKAKARAFLQQALQLNPDGIDPNYF